MMFGSIYPITGENLFSEEEENHEIYREIYGDPIYDIYEDDVIAIDFVVPEDAFEILTRANSGRNPYRAKLGFSAEGLFCAKFLQSPVRANLGSNPDEVTILSVLSGCSHSGLVEEGELIFNSLESKYGIFPGRKLYACMVDLLGRAGLVEKAERLLRQARIDADCIAWSSLLQSCRIHNNERIGRRAAEILMDLEPESFAVYIQVSKFYIEIGDFEISRRIREIAASRELMREIGYSSVVVKN